jgi:hypothetical protein
MILLCHIWFRAAFRYTIEFLAIDYWQMAIHIEQLVRLVDLYVSYFSRIYCRVKLIFGNPEVNPLLMVLHPGSMQIF